MAGEEQRDVSLWRLADLVTPMALRTAATLKVADHLAEGPRKATELAQETGTESGALDRLLRHLTGVGVVTRDGGGRYALTARGEELRSDHPGGLREWLDTEGGLGRAELAFVQLPHSVRTGTAAFPRQYARGFWEDLAADEERTRSYDRAMGVDVAEWAGALVPAYDWGALGHLVDVGGGNGTLLAALLTAFPELRGTVVDQPATAGAARATLAAAGLGDRGDAVGGSFFEALPKGPAATCSARSCTTGTTTRHGRSCAAAPRPQGSTAGCSSWRRWAPTASRRWPRWTCACWCTSAAGSAGSPR